MIPLVAIVDDVLPLPEGVANASSCHDSILSRVGVSGKPGAVQAAKDITLAFFVVRAHTTFSAGVQLCRTGYAVTVALQARNQSMGPTSISLSGRAKQYRSGKFPMTSPPRAPNSTTTTMGSFLNLRTARWRTSRFYMRVEDETDPSHAALRLPRVGGDGPDIPEAADG